MKLRIVSVGRPADREAAALHDRYAQRLRALGVELTTAWVEEVQAGRQYSDDHVRERESDALLAAAGPRAVRIALDPTGELLSTPALAERLPRWSAPVAVFLIGGPLGHHRTLRDRVERAWSLSPLTFPHELARVLVAEQLYRAVTLIRGLPYHK